MINKVKYGVKVMLDLSKMWLSENWKFQRSIRPETINLNANDICNSKCTMCNIWKQKQGYDVGYDDLIKIFSDPFYSEIKAVGITGGEPTLREDLIDVYQACIDSFPKLRGLSIITNCIKVEQVKEQLVKINNLCKKHNVKFHVMVSLDGVGATHDAIRGREGNFKSTIEVLDFVRNELKISNSFGCTISKENVWEADELLHYAKKHNLYGRFRVAEFIERLYNNDREEVIRNFTDEESYHLALFFEKVKRTYERKSNFKRTYSSIQNILLGGKRTIGCPYHDKGVLLNSKGEVAYCAPKSKIIGNALEESTAKIYSNNLDEKRRIMKDECDSCIHDYHAPITYNEKRALYKEKFYKKYLQPSSLNRTAKLTTFLKNPGVSIKDYSILIVGWYGTETVGDKAILGGIISSYQKTHSNLKVYVASLFPFITDQTVVEMQLDVTVVNAKNFEFLAFAKNCDETIMGGGPLMDLDDLNVPLHSFNIAKKYHKKTTVYGCGLGPIVRSKNKKIIQKILLLSDTIKLRDYKSVEYAKAEFGIETIEMIGDPAKGYVEERLAFVTEEPKQEIALFLRDWTFEYAKGTYSREEFEKVKGTFENSLASFIKQKADELEVTSIRFYNMHNFVVGGDDRDFSRHFIEQFFAEDKRVSYDKQLATVDSTIHAMKSSELNICMRFHSVLFAHTLESNFIAIDYTLGGKITAFLSQNNALHKMRKITDFTAETNEANIN